MNYSFILSVANKWVSLHLKKKGNIFEEMRLTVYGKIYKCTNKTVCNNSFNK